MICIIDYCVSVPKQWFWRQEVFPSSWYRIHWLLYQDSQTPWRLQFGLGSLLIPIYNISDLCSKKGVRVFSVCSSDGHGESQGCEISLEGDQKIITSGTYSSAPVYAMSDSTGICSSPLTELLSGDYNFTNLPRNFPLCLNKIQKSPVSV